VLETDRERFTAEIMYQLSRRVKKHIGHTKRKDSDFITARSNEEPHCTSFVAEDESESHESESHERDSESLDKEAYKKLRAEIAEAKA